MMPSAVQDAPGRAVAPHVSRLVYHRASGERVIFWTRVVDDAPKPYTTRFAVVRADAVLPPESIDPWATTDPEWSVELGTFRTADLAGRGIATWVEADRELERTRLLAAINVSVRGLREVAVG